MIVTTKAGFVVNPFGVPQVGLKEEPTMEQVKDSLPSIYLMFYGYTNTAPNSSRDRYYVQDWRTLEQAFQDLAEVLEAELPTVTGYSRYYPRSKQTKKDKEAMMRVDGEPINKDQSYSINDWEAQKRWIAGFAQALRTVEVEEKHTEAFTKMLRALDMYWISIYWQ